MSEHMAASAANAKHTKQTCRGCKRTVYVGVIDGVRVVTDTELVRVVTTDTTPPIVSLSRVMHVCRALPSRGQK